MTAHLGNRLTHLNQSRIAQTNAAASRLLRACFAGLWGQTPRARRPGSRTMRLADVPAWIETESLEDRTLLSATFSEFVDPNPNPGNEFGDTVVPLSTGNVVITSPGDDAGGTDAGAVYLFDGSTGDLISTLTGSANDRIGSNGVTLLNNGNFLITTPEWDNGSVMNAGAVTFGDGTTGVSGPISSSNSLVGTTAEDRIGEEGITVLSNGNYVVTSPVWDNGSVRDAGAVTFGDRTSGVSGAVSSSNSLVGTTADDSIGSGGVTALSNGNYVVQSPDWNNGSVEGAGAVTFGDGTSGISGPVTSSNSLVGTRVVIQVTGLGNGNYVVVSPRWSDGRAPNLGAVTFGELHTWQGGIECKLPSMEEIPK